MGVRRHYANAPIAEAVIDIQVRLAESITLIDLNKVHAGEESLYSQRETRNLTKGQFRVGKEVSASASSKPIGYLFRTADGRQIFQSRFKGFTRLPRRILLYGASLKNFTTARTRSSKRASPIARGS